LEKLQARREDAQRQLKYVCSLAGDDRIKAFLLNQNHYPEIRNVVEFLKDPCEGYQAIPSPSYEDIQNIYRRVVRIYIDFIFSKPQHANLLYVDSNHVIDALLRGLGICAQCASLHHTFRIGAAVMHPSFINRLYELNYSSQSGLWKPNDTHKDTPSIYRVGTEQRQTGYLRRALTMVTNAIGLK
ncbi:hypothetical protein JXB41_03575, partial [Candidatus Woesearchaeota archaeon]|nr:hypothetical protein [Candidatus Woesearchaeota archaeon]